MKQDLILAGVGGQGILTIAQAISGAALRRGLQVKQAEVHGMAQRGGVVQSHLRISDGPIHSDLIPVGQADLLIAVEPLESLRYLHFLGPQGAVVASINAFANIPNYPAVEAVLERLESVPQHVMIDADRVARAAGSGRASNTAVLGAASLFLDLDTSLLEEMVAETFAGKGEKAVEANLRAFRFGRHAGRAYVDGLGRGGSSAAVRTWIETLGAEHLARPEAPDAPVFDPIAVSDRLSGAEHHAVSALLAEVELSGRQQLFEHEVYSIIQLVGAISPPHHVFVRPDEMLAEEALSAFPGDQIVLKIVSPDIVHKTEAQGVVFVPKGYTRVKEEIDRLMARHGRAADVRGVLVVECVERVRPGFGNELFVGIRASREFGPIIAAGLGGIDTEYLAKKMRPGLAVAKALALETTAEEFLHHFRATAAYEILSGRARGHRRIVADGELLRCFRAFIHLANAFCTRRPEGGPEVADLEVNPFAFRGQRLVPLDGRGRLGTAPTALPARPREKLQRMLEPRSLAVLGVSEKGINPGRIILQNVLACGFDGQRVSVVKPGADVIAGVGCVDSIDELPGPVDMLVMASPAAQLPELVSQVVSSGKVNSAVLIPGGVGETDGSSAVAAHIADIIAQGRRRDDGGPVFLGPNSLGCVSRPGKYDTLFIPDSRLDKRWSAPGRRVALISQSGAFIVSRMSNLEGLDPMFAVSVGNQLDATAADFVAIIGQRDDVDVIGLYAEGFPDLGGLELAREVRRATEAGVDVVFYKAGRTEQGRSAAAGHTASVAGDYDVCQAALSQAGAIVCDTLKEFEQLLEVSAAAHDKRVHGVRIGAISNAGYEAVGMADALSGGRYAVELAELEQSTVLALRGALADAGLGALVNPRNPLDLTPMASDATFERVVELFVECPTIDAVVVGIVPLTAALKTLGDELDDPASLARTLPEICRRSTKPVVAVVDAGYPYAPLERALRLAGVPVFPSADQAVRSLGRYLCYRVSVAG